MKDRIAILPARGGSKRIPNKNIRYFCGKPMIAHVLETAKASGLFKTIHVSTDSALISSVVQGLGFPIEFMRPAELADDYTPIMPVLRFVLEQFVARGKVFDEVWLLMPCAPSIEVGDLVNAAALIDAASPGMSLVSISEYPVPIEWAFTQGVSGKLNPVQPGMFALRSQDIEPKFYDTGTFAVFCANTVSRSTGANSNSEYLGYVLPKGSTIDIDTEADWRIAEELFRIRQATHERDGTLP